MGYGGQTEFTEGMPIKGQIETFLKHGIYKKMSQGNVLSYRNLCIKIILYNSEIHHEDMRVNNGTRI